MQLDPIRPGDTIGIFSSSSPTTAQAVGNLQTYFKANGYQTKVAPHTLENCGYMAGTPQQRASDFNSLVADREVKMIMTANGGASALQIVSLVNYEKFARHPKMVVGLSDPSCLLNALTTRTGVPTVHGPNGYNFGHKTPTSFSEEGWWKIVTGNFSTPYSYPIDNHVKVLKKGNDVVGPLFGGNLRNIIYLIGTNYCPNFDGSVLFVEEIGMPIHEIDAQLNHLKLAGVFDRISGLIVGQFVGCEEKESGDPETLEIMISRTLREFSFPVVYNVPLGHTSDKITLIIGSQIALSTTDASITIKEHPFNRK